MVRQGYTRSEYNHCLCFKSLNDIFIILVLYVENMLIVIKSMEKINKLKVHMARNFDMKDIGAKTKILGIEIHKHKRNGKLIFPHEKYVEKILLRFEMNKAKPVNVTLVSHFKLSSSLCPSSVDENDYMSHVSYANTVGCLISTLVCTIPHIS